MLFVIIYICYLLLRDTNKTCLTTDYDDRLLYFDKINRDKVIDFLSSGNIYFKLGSVSVSITVITY